LRLARDAAMKSGSLLTLLAFALGCDGDGRRAHEPGPVDGSGEETDEVEPVEAGANSTPRLVLADVQDLPAGSAMGSVFSGLYTVNDEGSESCECNGRPCTGLAPQEYRVHGVWYLTQSGGRLQLNMRGGINTVCEGGIDDDGHFWCGRARSDQALLLVRGLAEGVDEQRVLRLESHLVYQPTSDPDITCEAKAQGTARP
jgi:hypothetical protein